MAVGVPLMVNTPPLKAPLTPAGSPVTPAPVPPPVIEYVMVVMAALRHIVWRLVPAAEVRVITAFGLTVIVPVAVACVHVPVVVTV